MRLIPEPLVRLVAFYLPQFHEVRENSEWWGPGFTEWTNVAKARPNFEGHYQPHIPRDLGFYDLLRPEVMAQQADLARLYGVGGFCFYYYWFAGRRILERPLENWVRSDIDFPYCVCWANENWTRRWDGDDTHVLLAQDHSEDDDRAFIRAVIPMLKDPRYIRVDGAPMLLVYRATLFPDPVATTRVWRQEAAAAGIPKLHLCAVQFYGITDPEPLGFDAAVEFPPHTFAGPENHPPRFPAPTNPNFAGGLVDYRKVVAQSLARPDAPYLRYRGVMPSWDNTARRQDTPMIFMHSSPVLYEYWLSQLVARAQGKEGVVFVNAWNEWGEGCHLEPDLRHGLAYLEATRRAVTGAPALSASAPADIAAAMLEGRESLLAEVTSLAEENRALREALDQARAAAHAVSLRQIVGRALTPYPMIHRAAARSYRLARSLVPGPRGAA